MGYASGTRGTGRGDPGIGSGYKVKLPNIDANREQFTVGQPGEGADWVTPAAAPAPAAPISPTAVASAAPAAVAAPAAAAPAAVNGVTRYLRRNANRTPSAITARSYGFA